MNWTFDSDLEGWVNNENTAIWTGDEGLTLGCIYAGNHTNGYELSGSCWIALSGLNLSIQTGDNISFWVKVVERDDGSPNAGTWTISLDTNGFGVATAQFWQDGVTPYTTGGFVKVSGVATDSGTVTNLELIIQQSNEDLSAYVWIDNVYVAESDPDAGPSDPGLYSALIGSTPFTKLSDLPFGIATPDSMAISNQGLIAIGAATPQGSNEMIIVSGDGLNWSTPGGAKHHGLVSKVASIRWLKPCSVDFGIPTGEIELPTDTDETVVIPPGEPGQVLVPGPDGQLTWTTLVLDNLGDVDTTTTPPADGDGLVYDETLGLWVPTQVAASVDWEDVENKPATFPPDVHGHDWTEITGQPVIAFPGPGEIMIGSIKYASITAAIAAASAGQAILLGAGTYAENVTINKNIHLRGLGQNATVLAQTSNSHTLSCSSTCFIESMKIINTSTASAYAALYIPTGVNGVFVTNCFIQYAGTGSSGYGVYFAGINHLFRNCLVYATGATTNAAIVNDVDGGAIYLEYCRVYGTQYDILTSQPNSYFFLVGVGLLGGGIYGVSAGKIIYQNQWRTFTPTLYQYVGVTCTIVVARYKVVDGICHMEFNLAATSAGTSGSKIVVAGFPNDANIRNPYAGVMPVGIGTILDSDTNAYFGQWQDNESAASVACRDYKTGGYVGVTPAFALAPGDLVAGSLTYEVK